MEETLNSVYAKSASKLRKKCEDVRDFHLKVEVMSFLHTCEANNKNIREMFLIVKNPILQNCDSSVPK